MLVNMQPDGAEYYDVPSQVFKEETTIEVDILIVGMDKKFRIRSLTLGQMESINQKATVDGKLDSGLFTAYTIVEGVIRPKFTKAHVDEMLNYNGEIMRELSEQIWQLGRVTKKTFDQYVEALSVKDAKK